MSVERVIDTFKNRKFQYQKEKKKPVREKPVQVIDTPVQEEPVQEVIPPIQEEVVEPVEEPVVEPVKAPIEEPVEEVKQEDSVEEPAPKKRRRKRVVKVDILSDVKPVEGTMFHKYNEKLKQERHERAVKRHNKYKRVPKHLRVKKKKKPIKPKKKRKAIKPKKKKRVIRPKKKKRKLRSRKSSVNRRKRNYGLYIKPYKGALTHEQFIDEYLLALRKRSDIVPNIYCSRSWLLAHKDTVVPAESVHGYKSFCKDDDFTHFFLPAYKYVEDDLLFKTDTCLVTFPQALGKNDGLRFDVQYMYTRDVSVYMIPKALKIRNTMNTIPYITYPIQYGDHSYDDKLEAFVKGYNRSCYKNIRLMTTDYEGFIDMLYNDYGQHRYVIERTDTHKILAVLIWEDVNDIIHMLYTVGHAENSAEYGFKPEEWKVWRRTKALRYPETILRYHFMKSFPIGTVFNGGGCSSYYSIRWMQEISQPSRIHELRTFAPVYCPVIMKKMRPPTGQLPWEYVMAGRHNYRFRVDETNRVLFQKVLKKNVCKDRDRTMDSKYRKRQIARILKLQHYGKILKKS